MSDSAHRESVRTVWNLCAAEGRADGMEQSHRDAVLQMLDRAGIESHHHVLDLGCGTGWAVRLIADLTPQGRVYGLDDAAKMVEHAREQQNPANVAFSEGCVEELPYADQSIHRILSMESVYYWRDIAAGVGEIARVLMPGGRVFLAMDYWAENPYVQDWPASLGLELHSHTAAEYESMLEAAGLVGVSSERLVDRRPRKPVEAFKPSKWIPDYETYLKYCDMGTLLVSGRRAGDEPPPAPAQKSDGETSGGFAV